MKVRHKPPSSRRRGGGSSAKQRGFSAADGGKCKMGKVKVNSHKTGAKVFPDGANVFKGEAKTEAIETSIGAIRVKTQTGGENLRMARVKM
ncbi:MAG: hypothetical protein ABSE97_08485 [Verrucomicrobiota bacterium]